MAAGPVPAPVPIRSERRDGEARLSGGIWQLPVAGLQKQARIAVVGAGWWACEYHIPHVRQNRQAELVSACRLGASELECVRRQFDLPHVTENHLEVYDQRPDGVIVASPHVSHFEHAAEALRRGCHVLVEKPMATRTADARELARLAGESGRTLMTPYGLNHTPYMEQAADWVRAGRIGAVRHVALHMSSALLDLFGGEPMLETSEHFYRPPPSTWADPRRAGGYGWGQLSHALAALFFVTDLAPESVHAAVHRSKAGVDDHDAAVLRFEGGAIGTLSGAAGLPKHAAPQLDLRIYGEDGMLVLDVEEGRERLSVRRHDGSGDERRMSRGEGFGSYTTREAVDRFIEICRGGEARNCGDHEVGLRTVQALEALYASADSGETVACG